MESVSFALTRVVGAVALALLSVGPGCKSAASTDVPASCKESRDCPNGTGVCRNNACTQVACTSDGPGNCQAGEVCDIASKRCIAGGTVFKPCERSSDCAAGTGVCRDKKCTIVPCGSSAPCVGEEQCLIGQCAPPLKASTGQTLAAGGSVSKSDKHVHIGLTGQGRAVGAGSTAAHKQVTGATSVLGR